MAHKKNQKMQRRGVIGANVLYCGHAGYFIADLYYIGGVCVVHASTPKVTPGNIHRHNQFGEPTHHLSDFPTPGFWKPEIGVFAVPEGQVKELGAPA